MPRQDRGIPLKSKTKSVQRPETVAMIYKRKWPAAVFLLPAFVFMVIFLFYPFIRNIIDSSWARLTGRSSGRKTI